MDLFSRLPDGSLIVQPEASFIPEFATLLSRNGDDPRLRMLEMGFVWAVADYKSPFASVPVAERFDRVIEVLRMPHLWKPDGDVANAIARYQTLQETASLRVLRQSQEALLEAGEMLEVITNRLTTVRKDPNTMLDRALMKEAIELSRTVLGLTTDARKAVVALRQTEGDVKKEETDAKVRKQRGGGEKGMFEDPPTPEQEV